MTPSQSEVAAVLRHLEDAEVARHKERANRWRLAFWIALVMAVRFAVGRM